MGIQWQTHTLCQGFGTALHHPEGLSIPQCHVTARVVAPCCRTVALCRRHCQGAIGRYAVEVPDEATEDWDLNVEGARQSPLDLGSPATIWGMLGVNANYIFQQKLLTQIDRCWVKLSVRTLVTRMFRWSIWKMPSDKVRSEEIIPCRPVACAFMLVYSQFMCVIV